MVKILGRNKSLVEIGYTDKDFISNSEVSASFDNITKTCFL